MEMLLWLRFGLLDFVRKPIQPDCRVGPLECAALCIEQCILAEYLQIGTSHCFNGTANKEWRSNQFMRPF